MRTEPESQLPLDMTLPPDPERVQEWERVRGYITSTKDNFHDAMLRGNSDDWVIMMYIAERTRSARKPRPEWVDAEVDRMTLLLNRSARTVLLILNRLEKRRWIARQYPENKTRRGGVKLLPENFRLAPLHPKYQEPPVAGGASDYDQSRREGSLQTQPTGNTSL